MMAHKGRLGWEVHSSGISQDKAYLSLSHKIKLYGLFKIKVKITISPSLKCFTIQAAAAPSLKCFSIQAAAAPSLKLYFQ
jgi:hypothetical protein